MYCMYCTLHYIHTEYCKENGPHARRRKVTVENGHATDFFFFIFLA